MMKFRKLELAGHVARKEETIKANRILMNTSLPKRPSWNKKTEVKG
jgi:hypothetical protein